MFTKPVVHETRITRKGVRIDPRFGTGRIFTFSPDDDSAKYERDYAAERAEYENAKRDREYGRIMRERSSVCG